MCPLVEESGITSTTTTTTTKPPVPPPLASASASAAALPSQSAGSLHLNIPTHHTHAPDPDATPVNSHMFPVGHMNPPPPPPPPQSAPVQGSLQEPPVFHITTALPSSADPATTHSHPPMPGRKGSFASLLQKWGIEQGGFGDLDFSHDDDDTCSLVSVDSVLSETSSIGLRSHGSTTDLKTLGRSPPKSASLTAPQLEKKVEGLGIHDHPTAAQTTTATTVAAQQKNKKLSNAFVWQWLTASKMSVPEDAEMPKRQPPTATTADTKLATSHIPEASKVDIQTLKKLNKKYPRYLRDLNAVSPSNW